MKKPPPLKKPPPSTSGRDLAERLRFEKTPPGFFQNAGAELSSKGAQITQNGPEFASKTLKTLGKSMILERKVIKSMPKTRKPLKTLVKSTFQSQNGGPNPAF